MIQCYLVLGYHFDSELQYQSQPHLKLVENRTLALYSFSIPHNKIPAIFDDETPNNPLSRIDLSDSVEMIEGFFQTQKVTQYSSSWRNCWFIVDEKNIHIYYRPNRPPKGVKANRVLFQCPIQTRCHLFPLFSLLKC